MKTDRSVLLIVLCLVWLGACAGTTADNWILYDAPAVDRAEFELTDDLGASEVARPARITVEQAVAEALDANRSVQQARLAAAIGETLEKEARSALIPSIGMRGSYTRVDTPPLAVAPELGTSFSVGPRDVGTLRFDMNFPIFGFGRHLNAYRASVLARRRTQAEQAAAEADIAAAATAAAFDLLEGIRAVEVARSNEAALERTVQDSQALLDAGTVTRSALLEAEVEYEQARREREKPESAIAIRRMVLNGLLGRPADAATEVVDDPTTVEPVWDGAALAEEALGARPELQAARLDVAAAERSLKSVIAAELPELRGNLSWETNNSPFRNPSDVGTAAVTLDVPIFTGGGRGARIRRARHELDIGKLKVRDMETQVRTEVATAHREVMEAFRDIAVAARNIEKAEESLRIQREKFRNGRATSRELLESNALLTNSRFAHIAATYNYNIALRELHRVRGADPRLMPFFDAAAKAGGEAGADGGAGDDGGDDAGGGTDDGTDDGAADGTEEAEDGS